MESLATLLPLLIIGGVVFLIIRLLRRKDSSIRDARERAQELSEWADAQSAIAIDRTTPRDTLLQIISDPLPHDETFFYRLTVLRAAARNPSLPPELQSAAINRIAQAEAAARIDKQLQAIAARTPRGFVGVSWDV